MEFTAPIFSKIIVLRLENHDSIIKMEYIYFTKILYLADVSCRSRKSMDMTLVKSFMVYTETGGISVCI